MLDLDAFRKQLTNEQRAMLNEIWNYYCKENQWMPVLRLHHKFSKPAVALAFKPLGGSIVFLTPDLPRARYQLTFLGVLLTAQWNVYEQMLVRYLEYICQRYDQDPEITIIKSQETELALTLTAGESHLLYQLIMLSHFWGGSGGCNNQGWTVGPPQDIDELPQVDDLREYIRESAVKYYDPNIPVNPRDLPLEPIPQTETFGIDPSALHSFEQQTTPVLDESLRDRCLPLLTKRDPREARNASTDTRLDTVVREMSVILEDRIRKAAGLDDARLVGVNLMSKAFGGHNPLLRFSSEKDVQESAFALYRGYSGMVRNEVMHSLVPTYTRERVLQLLGLVDYLLFILTKCKRQGEIHVGVMAKKKETTTPAMPDEEKGFLDFIIDGVKAIEEIARIISDVTNAMSAMTSKIESHASQMQTLSSNPGPSTPSEAHKIAQSSANDMNSFSQKLESHLPNFEKAVDLLADSVSNHIARLQLESVQEKEQVQNFGHTISTLLAGTQGGLKGARSFRESITSLRKKGISQEINRATRRMGQAQDGFILSMEKLESFCIATVHLIDEKLKDMG